MATTAATIANIATTITAITTTTTSTTTATTTAAIKMKSRTTCQHRMQYLHALAQALHCCKCFTCQIMQKYQNTIHIQIFAQAHAHFYTDMPCLFAAVCMFAYVSVCVCVFVFLTRPAAKQSMLNFEFACHNNIMTSSFSSLSCIFFLTFIFSI